MFEQLNQAITPFLEIFGDNIYTQAGLVIALSFIVASIFKYVLMVGLKAFIARIHVSLDSSFLNLLHTPIYYSLLLMGFSSAASIVAPSELSGYIIFSSLQSVAILIWTAFFLRADHVVLRKIALNPNRFHAVNNKTLPLFLNLVNIIILVLCVYFVFSVWGVDMTAWLASAGIVGILSLIHI